MKISKRDTGLLLMALGILIALLCYRFVYQKKVAEQEKLNSQLKTLEAEEQGMAELEANRPFYEAEIIRMNEENSEILQRFPADIFPENEIMYVVAMEEDNDIFFSDLSYGSAQELITGYEDRTGIRASDVVMNLSYTSTYQGLKDVILYTGGQDRRMVINTVSASYDRSNGNLSGSMTLDQYLITGTDAVYNPPYVPSMRLGTDNIFGTIEIPVNPDYDYDFDLDDEDGTLEETEDEESEEEETTEESTDESEEEQ